MTVYVNTTEAAQRFDRNVGTIRKWASLGHITAVDRDGHGRKLYRLADVARYDAEVRRRPRDLDAKVRMLRGLGVPMTEIARITGLPRMTCYRRLARAA